MNWSTTIFSFAFLLGCAHSSAQLIENFDTYSWEQKDSIIETLYRGGAQNVVGIIIDQAYDAETSKVDQDLEALATINVWKGIKSLSENNLVEAQNILQTSVDIYEQNPNLDRRRYRDALINLSDIFSESGDAFRALNNFDKAVLIIESDTSAEAATMLSSYIHGSNLAVTAGEFDMAESYGKKALSTSQNQFASNSNEYFQALSNLGLIYRAKGENRRSSNLILQAYNLAKNYLSEDDPNRIYYGNLAIEDLRLNGRFSAVEEVFEEQLSFYEANSEYQDDISFPVLLNQIGDFHASRNNLEQSYDYYNRANILFELRTENTDPRYIESQANVARILQRQGKYVEAETYYLGALRHTTDAFGENSWTEGYIRDNLASMYTSMQQHEQSLEQRKKANEIIEVTLGPNHPEYAVSSLNIGEAYLELGQDSLARDYLTTAYVKLEQLYGIKHQRVFSAAYSLAEYYCSRDVSLALDYYSRAAEFVEFHFLQILPLLPTDQRLSDQDRYGRFLDKYLTFVYLNREKYTHAVNKAFGTLLSVQRSREALDFPTTMALTKDPDVALRKNYNQWQSLRSQILDAQGKTTAERKEAGFNLSEMLAQIKSFEHQMIPGYTAHQVDLENDAYVSKVKARLQSGHVLINFHQVEWYDFEKHVFDKGDHYLAFIVGPTSGTIQVEKIQLNQNVLEVQQSRGQAAYAQQIWQPLEKLLSNYDHLLIVPDGNLAKVSFAALSTSDGGLVFDDFEITHLSSPFDILHSHQANAIGSSAAILVAPALNRSPRRDPDVSGAPINVPARFIASESVRQGLDFRPLSGNMKEVIASASKVLSKKKSLKIWEGEEVGKSNFHHLIASGTSMIHLSIPGLLLDENVISVDTTTNLALLTSKWLKSGLAFSGANQSWASDSLISGLPDDGLLTSLEVATLDLSKLDLLILDGIDLHQENNADGDAFSRLLRSFKLAGSKHIMVSLWPSSERSYFYQQFYKQVAKGRSVFDALQFTRKKMRKKYDASAWAGFIIL